MRILNYLRRTTPFSIWQTLGFLGRLRRYWRLDRSRALAFRQGCPENEIFVASNLSVVAPPHAQCLTTWVLHGVEWSECIDEVRDFLELSQSCSALIDIGAQTGFISALFSRSRRGPGHILSIEPDPNVHRLLDQARLLNLSDGIDWSLMHCALSDSGGLVELPAVNRVIGEPSLPGSQSVTVEGFTLSHVIKTKDWVPDIIKIDTESYESEIICGSIEALESIKPALQLEVHWRMLRDRDRDPFAFLGLLTDIGYRGLRKSYRSPAHWRRLEAREPVSRLALHT